jgi:hypothetical protein
MRFIAALLVLAACARAPSPDHDGSAEAPRAATQEEVVATASAPVASAAPSPEAAPISAPTATAPVEETVEAPPLFGEDGELLPQTEDEPSVASKLFERRVRSLFEAIAKNEPELARDFFFPRAAYEKVKAIKNPGRDWEARLWKLFVRDVGHYHAKIGDRATFVRIEVPMDKAEWMKPHREGNAIGYHRVKRAQLVYRDGDGTERSLEITSMIAWRGEWYVVHLHGFK